MEKFLVNKRHANNFPNYVQILIWKIFARKCKLLKNVNNLYYLQEMLMREGKCKNNNKHPCEKQYYFDLAYLSTKQIY